MDCVNNKQVEMGEICNKLSDHAISDGVTESEAKETEEVRWGEQLQEPHQSDVLL